MDFDTAYSRTAISEAGYVNNPADPGGETNRGISKRSYPDEDIRGMTVERSKFLYQRDFWIAGKVAAMPPVLQFQLFDAAVNHGIGNAFRILQRAVDVADDGVIGPLTMLAVGKMEKNDLAISFIAWRIRFWCKLSTWATFGKGWAMRAADDLIYLTQDN